MVGIWPNSLIKQILGGTGLVCIISFTWQLMYGAYEIVRPYRYKALKQVLLYFGG